MPRKISAGLLMYRKGSNGIEIFLVHPGGPFYKNKDDGVWSIPKGEVQEGESELLDVAKREFKEETGITPTGDFLELGSVVQKGGKEVFAWAFEKDWSGEFKSNTFEMEWPPKSGRLQAFPEVDKGEYFNLEAAKIKMNQAQAEFINRLQRAIEK